MKALTSVFGLLIFSCAQGQSAGDTKINPYLEYSKNILDYQVTPKSDFDKSALMFSDQGAWFAYGLHKNADQAMGFSGPFLMTQQNGVWLSASFMNAGIKVNGKHLPLKVQSRESYSSHLEQIAHANNMHVSETLVFKNGNTALVQTVIKNTGNKTLSLEVDWQNSPVLSTGISLAGAGKNIVINSANSDAKGYITFPKDTEVAVVNTQQFKAKTRFKLRPQEGRTIVVAQTFIFPENSWEEESKSINKVDFEAVLNARKQEKTQQLTKLIDNRRSPFKEEKYAEVLAKAHLTMQNNWRTAAGEIKHEGLFPSYHYKWFNGFWAWDSWKHSAGLSYYDVNLAKNQMRAMFDFQSEDGFIVDCIFRDTSIEMPNYRDTKPPLSAWAVHKIYEQDQDAEFVKEFYPKLKKYHEWWYEKRDHDKDGLCEFGSTDGTVIAAKWESGMDNAIRFDHSKILKNSEGAYSLDQESVDLNAYLYAEKIFLSQLSKIINNPDDAQRYAAEAEQLKTRIQNQFYDPQDGWFYDTSLDGKHFIKGEGSEGWTALWANAATQEQAAAVKNKLMDPKKFYTRVPFQTMSADHEKFNPLEGYWRGPNWLDQAYFAVKGLRNYGFDKEADQATIQIIEGAQGILGKGASIRENYHPLTGQGLNAQNFSWSAAHLIMLLQNE